ncbi:MAG: hypothetical protein EPO32_08785 [Anaerolineae bacterium]|nr:MAG: hypothetical protein EPO32_08785 [Anaerolineae bacterium]
MRNSKRLLKRTLGSLPLAAELDFQRRGGKPRRGFSLPKLEEAIGLWAEQAAASPHRHDAGKRVLVFGMLRYWVEHTSLLSLALAGLGHRVTLAYLPYGDWRTPLEDFDRRSHDLYAKRVLAPAAQMVDVQSLLDVEPAARLPKELAAAIKQVSVRDVQYTEQVEEINMSGTLFNLRRERNSFAARAFLARLKANPPEVVIVPNALILEFGALFQTARHLGIPVVSYEFGEQRDKIWFSKDVEVMLQDTRALWAKFKDAPFSEAQFEQVRGLFTHRRTASLYENFYRKWQVTPSEGAQTARAKLGLDDRPVAVLAANVIGDSLTLGRAVFSESMTEWLRRTLRHYAARPDWQFVLRVHPGEANMTGPSVADLARAELPELPENMHIVAATDAVNTYDLIGLADLGLVYTTTVGMEMAMNGLPAVVVGNTHYRGKGFTLDPASWDKYFALLEAQPPKLTEAQTRQAWHYAYRFFFDYPLPFPWHLIHFWDSVQDWTPGRVFSDKGMRAFKSTFDALVGEEKGN